MCACGDRSERKGGQGTCKVRGRGVVHTGRGKRKGGVVCDGRSKKVHARVTAGG